MIILIFEAPMIPLEAIKLEFWYQVGYIKCCLRMTDYSQMGVMTELTYDPFLIFGASPHLWNGWN